MGVLALCSEQMNPKDYCSLPKVLYSLVVNNFPMSNSGREVREMKVMLYCSLSESGLSTYSDMFSQEIFPASYPFLVDILHSLRMLLAWWLDGTVSYVALDSVFQ